MKYLKKFENHTLGDFDEDWEEEYHEPEWEKTRTEFVWTTANNKKFRLKDITDRHLDNLITYVDINKLSYGKNVAKELTKKFKKEKEYRTMI